MMSKKWFVLRTGTNREKRIQKHLLSRIQTHDLVDKIAQVLVLTERVTEIKNGQRRTVERKVYPGYVMAEIEVEEDGTIPSDVWHLIRDTPGQVKFVGSPHDPNKPEPLPDHEVEKMLQQQARVDAEEEGQVNFDFEVGQRVRIREGSFENFEGSIDELLPDKGQVKVSIMVFGRPTPIAFESWNIEKVEN